MNRLKLILILLLFMPVAAWSQRLPEGDYHADRERTVDILHYRAYLDLNPTDRSLSGKAEVTFQPLIETGELTLDAIRLDVKSVKTAKAGASLQFKNSGSNLQITLDRTYSTGDTVTLAIEYSCRPNAGMYFQPDPKTAGQYYVSTYGEGGLHANWIPVYNDVNDKFSTEMIVTVPLSYTVVSNGTLLEETGLPGGRKSFHWKQEKPHSNYLISIYAGEFEKGSLPPAFGSIPINYWVPKNQLKEGKFAFRNTTKMVEFFSNRLNYRYPWDKYDQIVVPDYAVGAMEHTSVTGHRDCVLRTEESAPLDFGPPEFDHYYNFWTAESTISHELAHHWFGDNLTCRNLSSIWLNESFASYMQLLWDEESLGKADLQMDRQIALDGYLAYVKEENEIRPLEYHYFEKADDIYNEPHTYMKGAIVLHMLRSALGDDAFFKALGHFLKKHEFGNVIGNDFKTAIEEATGQKVDWFFDDWIHGGGHPVLEVEYTYLESRKLIDLKIKQIQPVVKGQDEFTLPVDVSIATSKGVQKETVWIRQYKEQFFLPSPEEPLMVSIDSSGQLVAEIHFDKALDELLYQVKNDDFPGRVWALRQLVQQFPAHPKTLPAVTQLLSPKEFWGLQAEAALQLGILRTPAAENALRQALESTDYRIRKAAVLALPEFQSLSAERTLQSLIEKDRHTDVVAAAIVALARANSDIDAAVIRRQMTRAAWTNEIVIACLEAFKILGRKEVAADIRPFANGKHHQFVQLAALRAWKSCAPDDPNLHQALMTLAKDSPLDVQKLAVEMLGDLYVWDAQALLENLTVESGDENIRVLAKKALEKHAKLKSAIDARKAS